MYLTKYAPLIVIVLLITSLQLEAQNATELETNLNVAGNIIVAQDDAQLPVRGMIRFDTMTHTFQGYDGAVWIDLGSSGADVNNRTDTLEIGDAHGGGIVFFTAGSSGLVVMEFDLSLPSDLLEMTIPWGDSQISTNARSRTNGKQNTEEIVASNLSWSGGEYAAKICDDLELGGFDDWYMPAVEEFIMMNNNVGTAGTGANNNIANISPGVYWTSTELDTNEAIYYDTRLSSLEEKILTKDVTFTVRAIRAY